MVELAYPAQRFTAPVAQIGPVRLLARPGILLADLIDGTRVQPELLAAAGGQFDQVEAGMPGPVEAQRIFLPVIAVVPDEIHRPCLLVQQAEQGFHAVSIDQSHVHLTTRTQISSLPIKTMSAATPPAPFTPRPEGRGFLEQI
jgi:hypothetical protein